MLFLPDELLIRILLRLPVKSLLCFKCVSKSWHSLISDPHFARSHFELAAARTHRFMFLGPSTLETQSIGLAASLLDDSTLIKPSLQLPKPSFDVKIMGSCRGFLLLWDNYSYSDLYLWNPSNGVLKQLPLSPIAFTFLYGFAYDPSTDDYLVVLTSYDRGTGDWMAKVEFFSLRANSWEEIEGIRLPYLNHWDDPRIGLLLNDVIHWFGFRHDVSEKGIATFDMVERSLSEIPLPHAHMILSMTPNLVICGSMEDF